MSGIFGGSSQPSTPTTDDTEKQAEEAERQRQLQARASGYSSTILTSGQDTTPTTQKKTLLGT